MFIGSDPTAPPPPSTGFFRPARGPWTGRAQPAAPASSSDDTALEWQAAPNEPQTSDSSSSSPPPAPALAPMDGANIRYACFAAADLALPAMPIGQNRTSGAL
ncbi:hypothetical protein Zm00014a_035226 [Zea mays]|uniref:Uncharacterized protein n=1 Tax=Zea mays TaxID=4577 RepID=A0A3L6G4V6_MAIZE|nr:hypothetical protein Zm00014a_035226 [Zea mays]